MGFSVPSLFGKKNGGAPTGTRTSENATPETAGLFGGPWNPQTTYVRPEDQRMGNIFDAQIGQIDSQYQSDKTYLQTQGGLQAQGYQMEMDALKRQLGIAGGQAGIARANNAIDQEALARQGPLLEALYGLDKGAVTRGQERNHMDMIWGNQSLDQDLDKLNKNRGWSNQSLDQQLEELLYGKDRGIQDANFLADDQVYGLRSGAAARGAVTASGTRRSYGNIQTQLQNALSDITKNYDWDVKDVNRDREKVEATYGWGVADNTRAREQHDMSIRHRGAELGDQHTRLDLTHEENKAKLADDKRRLDNAAKSIGLSSAETSNRINAQIAKLGLQGQIDVNTMLKGIEDARNGAATEAANIANQIQQMSGIDFSQAFGKP